MAEKETQKKAFSVVERILRQTPSSSNRPWTTLTYAQSLNGIIGAPGPSPISISGPESSILTHALRYCHDGILIGIGTALSDNPRLNVRLPFAPSPIRHPRPIVIDPFLRLPLDSVLLTSAHRPILFYDCNAPVDENTKNSLQSAGATLVGLPGNAQNRLELDLILERLAQDPFEIHRVMIEGGSTVINQILDQAEALIDACVVTVSPTLLSDGPRVVSNQTNVLDNVVYEVFGKDVVVISTKWKA